MKTRLLNLTEHRTQAFDPHTTALMEKTYAGMAQFAGSGESGKTCADCRFRGYHRQSSEVRYDAGKELPRKSYKVNGCERFKQLTGNHGPDVPKDAHACKYFAATIKRN